MHTRITINFKHKQPAYKYIENFVKRFKNQNNNINTFNKIYLIIIKILFATFKIVDAVLKFILSYFLLFFLIKINSDKYVVLLNNTKSKTKEFKIILV